MDKDEDFSAYVAARYGQMVRAALLLGCGSQDAEDAVQDALASCYRSWAAVAAATSPDAYAHRVLVNRVLRGRRRRWAGEIPHGDLPEATFSDHAAAVADSASVRAALARLPPEQRAVLVLRYFSDLTEAQTAQALGIAIGTVKSRASRALALLVQDPALPGLGNGERTRR